MLVCLFYVENSQIVTKDNYKIVHISISHTILGLFHDFWHNQNYDMRTLATLLPLAPEPGSDEEESFITKVSYFRKRANAS